MIPPALPFAILIGAVVICLCSEEPKIALRCLGALLLLITLLVAVATAPLPWGTIASTVFVITASTLTVGVLFNAIRAAIRATFKRND
jgi:hypothetical protein